MVKQFMVEKRAASYFPEYSNVEALLSCFYVGFTVVAMDELIAMDKKEKCLKFLDLLIGSYESCLRMSSVGYKSFFTQYTGVVFLQHKSDQIESALRRGFFGQDSCVVTELFSHLCPVKEDAKLAEKIWMFFSRAETVLKSVLAAEEFEHHLDTPSKSATTLCRMLAANAFGGLGFDDLSTLENASSLLKEVLRVSSRHRKADAEKVQTEGGLLTEPQLLQLVFYLSFKGSKRRKTSVSRKYECLDPVETACMAFLDNDVWKLKQLFSSWLGPLPEVSLQFVRDSAPTCYQSVLKTVSEEGKVKMSAPGEITFFPLKHCRWCGLVEEADEFEVCRVCLETPDYPDRCVFCSRKCQEEALDDLHTEEHARYLLVRLGLGN